MSDGPSVPTPTDLLTSAAGLLVSSGYEAIESGFPEWATHSTRLFEDAYGVVGLAVFATCAELLETWPRLQGALVDAISQRIGQSENKAWDGYLVLLTPGPATDASRIEDIRYDTTRLRKLVATGDDLTNAGDVERVIRPLLPLIGGQAAIPARSALDMLPSILADGGINPKTTTAILQAFFERRSLVDAIYRGRATQ